VYDVVLCHCCVEPERISLFVWFAFVFALCVSSLSVVVCGIVGVDSVKEERTNRELPLALLLPSPSLRDWAVWGGDMFVRQEYQADIEWKGGATFPKEPGGKKLLDSLYGTS